MDDDKIVISAEFLDSFVNDLEELHLKFFQCFDFVCEKNKGVFCGSCDKVKDCPFNVLSSLISKLNCIVSGDVNEWN